LRIIKESQKVQKKLKKKFGNQLKKTELIKKIEEEEFVIKVFEYLSNIAKKKVKIFIYFNFLILYILFIILNIIILNIFIYFKFLFLNIILLSYYFIIYIQ
jgi:uncharacterized membrane protein